MKAFTIIYLLLLPLAVEAQTFTVLHTFQGSDGAQPQSALVQGFDGNFYGTTAGGGGPTGHGTIFKITPSGLLTTLFVFDNLEDGAKPYAGLTLGPDGAFYGDTWGNTSAGLHGTVFRFSAGVLTTLHTFNSVDGAYPYAPLLLAGDGNFYGTTTQFGTDQHNAGTVFRISRNGDFASLHTFALGGSDGEFPYGQVVQNGDGALFGTTQAGGAHNVGTVFKIDQAGNSTTLYSFCSVGENCTDGATVYAGLAQGNEGAVYGVTYAGGNVSCQPSQACGTVFKFTPQGLTTLHAFNGSDGGAPQAPLYEATDGNFYGTASSGAILGEFCFFGCGTVFSMTPSGSFTVLHSFCESTGCPDGAVPQSALVQGTDGDFYGMTDIGGSADLGVVYKLSLGLPPFVKLLPAFGTVGQSIRILGTDLLGTIGVTFDETPAEFTVNTNSFITATVPTGATSGSVRVTTPNGVLSSNVIFRVSQ
jgi:uncharacterized repeat protein (TIGR03803 family)